MRRTTPLTRSTALKRTPLKLRHLAVVRDEPGRDAWKERVAGLCSCGCYEYAPRLHRHHVVLESLVRRHGGDPWSFANCMTLHPYCHACQHSGFRRIRLAMVPPAAIEFARELMGEDQADLYFSRHYSA